jgi:type II secretory ATPase GspE/PulE/Tfp pilus assembly ATPase PilB-like protein
MRLFSRQEGVYKLTDLGMKEWDLNVVRRELRESAGMILASGPTGSGKTTTVAACINEVNRPELKVISLEDPIEYRLAGVEQTEVDSDSGYTFAVGLRTILRQDPDVIFVGEMRDMETAETAIHASMSGHLVFSTIHSNDAVGVILRMADIGVRAYVLAPAINLVIAQRLVRKVCEHCGQEYKVDAKTREHIKQVMEGVREEVFDKSVLDQKNLTFIKSVGCKECGGMGYRGRTGAYELFAVKGEIEELILSGVDSQRIGEAARRQGMTTIAQDAYIKVINHITTVEEVERVSEE